MKKLFMLTICLTITLTLLPNLNASVEQPDRDMYKTDEPITVTQAITDAFPGEYVHVEGVVTHVENEENFYIQNNQTGDGLYVRLSEPIESIEQGHKVTVFGWSNIYTGFGNNHHSIREAEVTSHDSTQHEIFITKEMSVNEIIEAYELFDEEGPGRNTAPYTNYRIFKLENVDFISPVGQWNRLVDPAYHNQELSDATQGSDGEVHLAYDPSTTNIEGLSENTLVEGETIESMTFLLTQWRFGEFTMIPLNITKLDVNVILNGPQLEYLTVGDTYEEQGASAKDSDGEPLSITIDGEVDTDIPGTYTIEYSTQYEGETYSRTRTIIVEGAFIPTLELIGDDIIHIDFGDTYEDEGAKVVESRGENFEILSSGPIDTLEAGEHKITYTTTASDGTIVGPIERTVVVQNPDAPVFDAPDSIIKNADYIAPTDFYYDYITATDFEGNDITESLEIIKNDYNGNANKSGTYEIIFRATDTHDTSSRYTLEITVQRNLLPLLIIDQQEFVLSYVYEFKDEDFVDTLKSIDVLANETFIFTDEYDNYSPNFNSEGTYSKEFSLLSESGNTHEFNLDITVVDDDAEFIQAEMGFIAATWEFIQSWWIALGVIVLIIIGLKAR